MLPLEIPAGTTVESLVRRVVPELHGRLVPEGVPDESLSVAVRVEGAGSWTVRIRGREMRVEDGEFDHPTLWFFTTAHAVAVFLEDALGPRRFLPKSAPEAGPVFLLSDPRIVKRAAMVSGRVELALRDLDGQRLTIVLGLGQEARRGIDPEDPDAVVEADASTLERILEGTLTPADALVDGEVTVRGNRLLAMQLALAVTPFYPAPKRTP